MTGTPQAERATSALERVGSTIWWPESRPGMELRSGTNRQDGRLFELAAWSADVQNSCPPRPYLRVRLVLFGTPPTPPVLGLAESVGATPVPVPEVGPDVPAAVDAGIALADAEVESGADLLVLAGSAATVAATAVVSTLTGQEPVKVLRRGTAALDAETWMARAVDVRDTRCRIVNQRGQADRLLDALGDPLVAFATGVLVGASARRTPVVLDGPLVHAAALVATLGRPAASAWWQVADSSEEPVVTLAQDRLRLVPVLGLSTSAGDGTAGLLCVPVLRAAVDGVREVSGG